MADPSYNIDFDFLAKHEGKCKIDAYVPNCTAKSVKNAKNKVCYGKPVGSVIGKSGITVATGFDLGWHNKQDLKRMHFPPDMIKELDEYLTLNRSAAQEKLKQKPLKLNLKTAKTIDKLVRRSKVNGLARMYNHDAKKGSFALLPSEAQTAIFSMYYQMQGGLKKNHPKLWDALVSQDWQTAVTILEGMKQYADRRKEEATLLKTLIPPSQ